MRPKSDTLERLRELAELTKSEATYYEVRCYQCWFNEPAWTRDEAKVRGQVHEQATGGHETEYQKIILGDDPPGELGFGDGGMSDEFGDD